ncbi:MAG TPA: chromate transporter [Clostridiales bacterium]|nr:chromate transporter [Clostridiales bacterium]HQK73402.1 chromate transporter [Clostridiales bacterium]
MIYLRLFWSFVQIGLFSFGGGLAVLPQIQYQAVEVRHWLTLKEFVDLVSLSEMTPGPIAINAATFVGMRQAGILGALASTFGCVLPSLVIVVILAVVYKKFKHLKGFQGALGGLRPAACALIISAGLTVLMVAVFGIDAVPRSLAGAGDFYRRLLEVRIFPLLVLAGATLLLQLKKVNPVLIIASAGVLGILQYALVRAGVFG